MDEMVRNGKAKRRVTLVLTPEQKQEILDSLGLFWDHVTFDSALTETMTPQMFDVDPNLVVAQGRPTTKGE